MLKPVPVLNQNSVLACLADCPADIMLASSPDFIRGVGHNEFQKEMRFLKYLIIIFLFSNCDLKSAMDYTMEAEKLIDQGRYNEANLLLDKAIEKDSKYIGAYINKGANFSELGEHRKAIQVYLNALTIDPNNTMLLFNLGNNYRQLEEYTTSIQYYNNAFKTKGGDLFYMDYNKDFDYVNLGQDFDVAGEEIYFQRGLSYLDLDSIHQSYSDFNNCIRRDYEVPASLYYIGFIYLKNYQDSLGCESLKKSASLGYRDALIALQDYCE